MRIVLLPSAYHPSVGGVEVLTARLAKSLITAGYEVEVWTGRSAGDSLPAEEQVDGITVRRFDFAAPRMSAIALARWLPGVFTAFRELRKAQHAFGPDVLHVQCFSNNGAYAAMLSQWTGTPLVVTLQGETVMDDHDIYEHSTFMRAALRFGLWRATRVTGCSQFTLNDALARFRLDAAKARVIYNGVDEDEAVAASVEVPFQRFVVALGRVVPKKGFDLLIDAFAEVALRAPGIGLVVGGDGDAMPSLRAQVESLNLVGRVHFPGKLDRSQVAGLLSRAEVFVMPSRLEPFGIVALEGWRAGLPVVVSNRGGAGEFVEDGHSGLVVDPTDRTALADAIVALAGDSQLRSSLGSEGGRRLPDFAWHAIRQQYEEVYSATGTGRRHSALR